MRCPGPCLQILACGRRAAGLRSLAITGWAEADPPSWDWLPAGLQHLTLGFQVPTVSADGAPQLLNLGGAAASLETLIIFIDEKAEQGLPALPVLPKLQKIGIWATSYCEKIIRKVSLHRWEFWQVDTNWIQHACP